MLRPLVAPFQVLATALRSKGLTPVHVAAVAIGILALLSGWFIGQAWVSASSRDTAGIAATTDDGTPAPVARQAEARPSVSASLALSTETVKQEDELTVGGSGFGPLEPVILRATDPANGEAREISRLAADWRGVVAEQSVKLPEWLTSGAQTMELLGERSGIRAPRTLYVRSKEHWLNLGSYGVKQAERVGFIAGGFEPETNVSLYLAEGQDRQPDQSAEPFLAVPTDRAGNTAWTEFEVPLVKSGTYSLMVRGENEQEALSRNIVINALRPWVELSPWSGPPGSRFDVNASEFVPGEEVGVYLGDATEPALTVNADEQGNLWGAGPVELPYEATGRFRVTLIGSESHALVTSAFGVTPPKPWVELSTYAGFAGTSVFFSGGGFAARERVTVHVGGTSSPAIYVGEVNEQGYYRQIGPVNVPPDAEEEVTFVLAGERSGARGEATFKVLVPWVPGLPEERP